MTDLNGYPDVPIYYIIAERDSTPQYYSKYRIIKSMRTSMMYIDRIYREYVMPLYQANPNIQTFIFEREPDNPLRDKAEEA